MDDRENKHELVELMGKAVYVPDTSPPVYMLDGVLIGYDKLERMKIIAATNKSKVEPVENKRKEHLGILVEVFARVRMKLATMKRYNTVYAPKN